MTTILIYALAVVLSACQNEKKPVEAKTSVEDSVREVYLASIEGFNNGDLDAFLINFASNITMYGTDGTYEGHDALRERFQPLLEQFPEMKMDILKLTTEALAEEVVLVHFQWKLYPFGQGPAYEGIGSGVYTNQQGNWREILEVETVTHVDEALQRPIAE